MKLVHQLYLMVLIFTDQITHTNLITGSSPASSVLTPKHKHPDTYTSNTAYTYTAVFTLTQYTNTLLSPLLLSAPSLSLTLWPHPLLWPKPSSPHCCLKIRFWVFILFGPVRFIYNIHSRFFRTFHWQNLNSRFKLNIEQLNLHRELLELYEIFEDS